MVVKADRRQLNKLPSTFQPKNLNHNLSMNHRYITDMVAEHIRPLTSLQKQNDSNHNIDLVLTV